MEWRVWIPVIYLMTPPIITIIRVTLMNTSTNTELELPPIQGPLILVKTPTTRTTHSLVDLPLRLRPQRGKTTRESGEGDGKIVLRVL
jgi:hypothetical protein